METLIRRLSAADVPYLQEEPLSKHTSFRIGGPAELMAFPRTEAELSVALRAAAEAEITPVLLGAGTNVLAPDEGKRGLIICTRDCLVGMERLDETSISVMAGVPMARAALFARDQGLGGMEFAHGIPGTVGGGIFMNAGAYGGELRQIAEKTRVMDFNGEIREYIGEEQGFGYRTSAFQSIPCVIIQTEFRLVPEDRAVITSRIQELNARRRASQPLELPSAGSTFKRPKGGYAAALIEQAGLKGQGVGGARVSSKHAGFVVNIGGATEKDVLATIEMIRNRVYETSGIVLEPEVKQL